MGGQQSSPPGLASNSPKNELISINSVHEGKEVIRREAGTLPKSDAAWSVKVAN